MCTFSNFFSFHLYCDGLKSADFTVVKPILAPLCEVCQTAVACHLSRFRRSR